MSPEERPQIRHSLEFDDTNVDNISKLVFNGMKNSENRTGQLSKEELKTWVKVIMAKKCPDKNFNDEMFEKGFRRMDMNKDGVVNIEDIKLIVRNRCKREGLYVGNK